MGEERDGSEHTFGERRVHEKEKRYNRDKKGNVAAEQ